MTDQRKRIQLRLIANMLVDVCKQHSELIFREAWCSQERCIRFSTPFFIEQFPPMKTGGYFSNGMHTMYEVWSEDGKLEIRLTFCRKHMNSSLISKASQLLHASGTVYLNEHGCPVVPLKVFYYSDSNQVLSDFESFLEQDLPLFENQMFSTLKSPLHEGEKVPMDATRYERNPYARAACIAFYGRTCRICGMNFSKVYGQPFAKIIEVHHIIPISEIGHDYIVDPIHDLIPLCPNCHTAIHSNSEHVYSVEEIKKSLLENQ